MLTPNQKAEIVTRYRDGEAIRKIAKNFGATVSYVQYIRRAAGIPPRRPVRRERAAAIIRAYIGGARPIDIARRYGVSDQYVQSLRIAARVPARHRRSRQQSHDKPMTRRLSIDWMSA
jgi:hypothetical protein